jgi:hypothetical protein
MNHSEQIAKLLIEAMIVGARMQYRCDQSSSVHDFDLQYANGTVAAVEVTASVIEQMERTAATISDERKGGPFVRAKKCRNGWWVHPLPGANINKIRTHVDEHLAAIEAEGRHQFFAYTDANTSPAVARILRELWIEAGDVMQWKPPNCIGIAFPGQGGWVSAEHVQRAIEAEANKEDNRRKLAVAGMDERHLFVYVDPQNYLPWVALVDEHPPQQGPSLPSEITYVWAATRTRSAEEFVVWKAERGKNWQYLGVIVAPLPLHERGSS